MFATPRFRVAIRVVSNSVTRLARKMKIQDPKAAMDKEKSWRTCYAWDLKKLAVKAEVIKKAWEDKRKKST